MTFVEVLELFESDPETQAVVLIGEIGGSAEEEAAEYIARRFTKPVVAYIAGRTAPPGKRMGHAGAVISGTEGTAQSKIEALRAAGVAVADLPSDVPGLLQEILGSSGNS
jgi:succinyl-CoA synthetase alpha subunit